jgi:NADH-quinone oxidoreductase subunit L
LFSNLPVPGSKEITLLSIVSGDLYLPIGFLLDPLSLLMLLIVTGISLLVQVYSLGYMAHDPGFARYYGFMSFFVWSMSNLVLSPTILQLFLFWELVGMSSYLLIGFWFEKFSATRAGRKAFIMTRIGDISFYLGLLMLMVHTGTLSIVELTSTRMPHEMPAPLLTLSVLLVFGGIIGKSAQFPLMTWLPDAMEGPTPVSALLHSATMVAAGVFLFARLFPLFSLSETAMTVTLFIATVSMLMSATMAMVSRDIKQVWAYSTISQLGFMIMGLGAGGYVAGVFHLTTHAVFKALLFLCAGVLIHHYHTNDLFEIGRKGGRSQKIPMVCLIIAAASLSGVWPLSGFFSKERIVTQLALLDNPAWLIAGFVGIFLTAYYTARLIFIVLFPKEVIKPQLSGHSSGLSTAAMLIPLIVLAGFTLILGFTEDELFRLLSPENYEALHGPAWLAPLSIALVALAIVIAWIEFGRKQSAQVGFVERSPACSEFFKQRWYLDHLYGWINSRLLEKGIAEFCKNSDLRWIDGLIRGLCSGLISSGRALATGHRIQIQSKLVVIFGVVFGLIVFMLIIG